MYSYIPAQFFTMHQHPHLQQYNQAQFSPMPNAYIHPPMTPVSYTPQPIDQQQFYRTDQFVPQIVTPIQHQIPHSSSTNIIQISSPHGWLTGSPIPMSQDVFRPIPHDVSRTMFDILSFNNHTNNNSSTPSAHVSFGSPKLTHFHNSEDHRQRQRLYSGSSCYESESSDDDEFGWRTANSKIIKTKQSNSRGRENEQDIYQASHYHNEVVPAISTYYRSPSKNNHRMTRPKLIQYIDKNIIGNHHIFNGPWGLRRMIYCDYTASSRSLVFIENYIRINVLPSYGNTHSETSFCAQQSTKFREEARNIIKKSVNANEDDLLLFTGTGSTGAVHALVHNFDLHNKINRENTIVIISVFECHSNLSPWKETGVELIQIPNTQQGILDKSVLIEKLEHYSKIKKRIICSLNAASNITGIYNDVDSISTLVHSYSGFIFWDYATAAPHVKINMNPSPTAYKDGIFISTHKFIGGPGTPGILIAKKNLFSLKAPRLSGGGTVNFVTRTTHEYNYYFETREEGGTPNIIGCIRAGLVFQLKDSVDINYIQTRGDKLVKRFFRRCKKMQNLILLGSQTAPRLPIFSFLISIPGGNKYLHPNFVCRLFNDLFGMQVRSGCACGGPYGLELLNVNDVTADISRRENEEIIRLMIMKTGFTRLNLSYFSSDNEIDFILDAVEFIATHGWKFLPLYTYEPVSGMWEHRSGFQLSQSSLEDITYKSNKMQHYTKITDAPPARSDKNLPDVFREAKFLAADAVRNAIGTIDYTYDPPLNVPDKSKHMIWFALPIDIALLMMEQGLSADIYSIPFIPNDAKAKTINSAKIKSATHGHDTLAKRKKNKSKHELSLSRTR